MAKKITEKQLLQAIAGSKGIIKNVRRKLIELSGEKISWDTGKAKIESSAKALKALNAEKEMTLDDAETVINEAIEAGDLATAKWYLRMKGKERGYEDSSTVKLDAGDPLNICFTGLEGVTQAEFLNADNVEIGGTSGGKEGCLKDTTGFPPARDFADAKLAENGGTNGSGTD